VLGPAYAYNYNYLKIFGRGPHKHYSCEVSLNLAIQLGEIDSRNCG